MKRVLILPLIFGVACPLAALAQQPATADIQPDDISRYVEQLQSPEFAERQEATRQLSEAGKAAFAELEKASASGSRETSGRALDVLKGHFQKGDNETKAAAKDALDRLANHSNPALGQRAQSILNPPPKPSAADIAAMNAINAPIRIAPLQIQVAGGFQGGAIAPAGLRSTTVSRNPNGDIRILIRDNGKTTQIQSTQGKITAEITETQNGKVVTKSIEAKDLDDLKKKDAELARLYEQYSQPPGVRVVAQRALPAGGFAPRTDPADSVKRMIETLDKQIEQLKAQAPNNPAAQRSIESLQNVKQTYQRRLDDLNKPAAPKPAAAPVDDPFANPRKPATPAESKAIGGQ